MLFTSLFLACANPIPPAGGDRDETPPQIDTAGSTPNYQTNFSKQPIEVTFDEWIELNDIYNQVIVSPPLSENPEVKIKKRTVIFTFPEGEELRPNATYTINFGEGIRDLTEKNPADVRFVFSTGDQLDSLSMSGLIVDALTGEAAEGVLFLLYENLADSVVFTERPFYFGKTDKAGRFEINNIKEGVFKGLALKDEGRKYLFDSEEAIGFPDSLITINGESSPKLEIRLFEEAGALRLLEEDTEQFGMVRLTYNQTAEDLRVRSSNGSPLYTTYDKDTLRVWYAEEQSQQWKLFIGQDSLPTDTITVPARESGDFLDKNPLRRSGPQRKRIAPNKSVILSFNHPLALADTSLISLYEDSTRTMIRPGLAIDSLNPLILRASHTWKAEIPYELVVLPGGVYDIFGLPNLDTIRQDFLVEPRKNFGNLNLRVTGLDSLEHYIIQVRDKTGNALAEEIVTGMTEFQKVFDLMPPGEYVARIITDWNANQKWDTGSYQAKRQPEPIFLKALEQLRANWDVEAVVELGKAD